MHNGRVVLLVRTINSMSIAGFAEELGVGPVAVSRIENGATAGSKKFWDRFKDRFLISQAECGAVAKKWETLGNTEFARLFILAHRHPSKYQTWLTRKAKTAEKNNPPTE